MGWCQVLSAEPLLGPASAKPSFNDVASLTSLQQAQVESEITVLGVIAEAKAMEGTDGKKRLATLAVFHKKDSSDQHGASEQWIANKVTVTLWGNFADFIDDSHVARLVLLRDCKVTLWQGVCVFIHTRCIKSIDGGQSGLVGRKRPITRAAAC